ncbi:hypothetical protein L950_0224990 [Sphingobacterium sp. IITKGP-BTPF85]|nr:hypothetical protein L950_0224990 [Sphingobacterium sp. IITKGP-BTPF85]
MWKDKLIKKVIADQRLTVWHIALIMAIISVSQEQNGNNIIRTSRKVLNEKSLIGSFPTYHKCLKDLICLNYLEYNPSYHPKLGSEIRILF